MTVVKEKNAFEVGIEKLVRTAKPRNRGLTMMFDWGVSRGRQEDFLELAGEYLDLAKIAGCSSTIIKPEVLKQKLRLYRDWGAIPFPGGVLFEYAHRRQQVDEYLATCHDVYGFDTVEISDDGAAIPLKDRVTAVARAVKPHGLRVLAEVGSKAGNTLTGSELGAEMEALLEAGAWKVLLEAAMLFDAGKPKLGVIDEILRTVPQESVVFEVPGTWINEIPHVSLYDVFSLQHRLIEILGPDVNLGNVSPEGMLYLETVRRGMLG